MEYVDWIPVIKRSVISPSARESILNGYVYAGFNFLPKCYLLHILIRMMKFNNRHITVYNVFK